MATHCHEYEASEVSTPNTHFDLQDSKAPACLPAAGAPCGLGLGSGPGRGGAQECWGHPKPVPEGLAWFPPPGHSPGLCPWLSRVICLKLGVNPREFFHCASSVSSLLTTTPHPEVCLTLCGALSFVTHTHFYHFLNSVVNSWRLLHLP